MRGLYRKALSFHELTLEKERAVEAHNGKEDGISAEERAKIASRIDDILADHRIQISPQTLAYTPKRRGAFLPVVSNIAVLAAFALAGVIIFRLLNHQERYIASGQTIVQGAEAKLIAAMRKDAQRQLREKDQAILDAEQKLQALPQEEQRLREQTESALKAREQELSAQFDRRLALEKERLGKQGLSAAEQSRRLRKFEAARRNVFDSQLAAARQQSEADFAVRQKSLAVLASQVRSDLDTARRERTQIQNDFTQREADLRSPAQPVAQPPSAAAAAGQLAQLQAQTEKGQLVLDQILGGYSRVIAALQKQDFEEAQSGLDSLRSYLEAPSVASLPAIRKRRAVELFLIDSLSDLIRSRRSAASSDTASIAEAAAQIRSVSELVARGEELSKAGNQAAARDAYLQAIQVIAPVNRGYLSLEDMRAAQEQESSRSAIAGLEQANVFCQAGNFQGSIEQYRRAASLLLKDNALARQLTDNLMNAGYHALAADDLAALARFRTDAQKRQAVLERLRDIRRQYLAYKALLPESSDPAAERSLASLLQAKILLLQILDSDPVRSQHPELGVDVERYFLALEQQGKTEGRKAALDQLASMLGATPSVGGSADPLAALLDRLEQILSGQ